MKTSGFPKIVVLAMFCLSLCSCCEKEPIYDNDINKYRIALTESEFAQDSELQVITAAYSKSLSGVFGLFTKKGPAADCDKEVVLACKDAEYKLNGVRFNGNYTVEAVRLTGSDEELIYTKTYSSTSTTRLLQRLS